MTPTPSQRLTCERLQRLPQGPYWRIHSGLIRSFTWTEDGESITTGVWGPGDIVSSNLSSLEQFELECQNRVEVESIEEDSLDLQTLTLEHFRLAEQLLSISRTRRYEYRLARLLEWLAHRFGTPEDEGYTIALDRIYLTHDSLGDLNGSTRVTVTRLLQSFQRLGAIAYRSRHSLWINPARLPHRTHHPWLRST